MHNMCYTIDSTIVAKSIQITDTLKIKRYKLHYNIQIFKSRLNVFW